jgi:parvulin-like peptidyl-prolyl isomerase
MARNLSNCSAKAGTEEKTGRKRLLPCTGTDATFFPDGEKCLSSNRAKYKFFLGGLFLVATCLVIRSYIGAEPAKADPVNRNSGRASKGTNLAAGSSSASGAKLEDATAPQTPQESEKNPEGSSPASTVPALVAAVNSQRITREELARECLRRFGNDVLESMVNKQLIVQECKRQGISVTRADAEAEIQRLAKRFDIPVDQFLKMIKQERNITREQYANDIIWPTLALRQLAGVQAKVTREELVKEYEIQYGEKIRARLIAVSNLEKAQKLQAQAAANPKDFGNLAKDYSEDAPSASAKGVILPICKHGTYKEIEDAVFNKLADGQVSEVIHAGGQYVILLREGVIPAIDKSLEQVSKYLEDTLRDRKMRSIAQTLFQDLQQKAKVVNVWNDPALRERMPGVAATVNQEQITLRELSEACIMEHGTETLEGIIVRKILEQACKKQNVKVTEDDIDQEIARAALMGVKPKADGSPDVEAWLELITKKQGVPLAIYRSDAVWPSVAVKKLVGDKVQVTEEDLRKGFEANYGPRVRCLAIVLNNQRRAQEVFEMARKNSTAKNFGDLAAQYSIEPGSQQLRGEVPPIKRHGGQPILEEEAFNLKPGELSGVIQVADKFIILRCEDFTKPINVDFAQVRNDIYQDLHEKKLRLAMADRFESLREAATVDNYLTNTSHSPKQKTLDVSPSANIPALHQAPGN